LIDSYIAFARGAASATGGGQQVTEAQYKELKNEKSFIGTLATKRDRLMGGAKLLPEERQAMYQTMIEAYNNQAHMVNNRVNRMRKVLQQQNPDLPETLLPHSYPIMRNEASVNEEIQSERAKANKIYYKLKTLRPGTEEYSRLYNEHDGLVQHARKLTADLMQAKNNGGEPINIDELNEQDVDKAAGWMRGLFPKGAISGVEGSEDSSGSVAQ
jgi:hypothetical protein